MYLFMPRKIQFTIGKLVHKGQFKTNISSLIKFCKTILFVRKCLELNY